jgi:hypothetical protein
MGKKAGCRGRTAQPKIPAEQPAMDSTKPTDFSISEKHYVEFFEFLKELHLTERQ